MIDDFLKTQLGDPASGAYEPPATYQDMVALLEEFQERVTFEVFSKKIYVPHEQMRLAMEMNALINYVRYRKRKSCGPFVSPSADSSILTGILGLSDASHMLGMLEEYMDERPDVFGKIKLEK